MSGCQLPEGGDWQAMSRTTSVRPVIVEGRRKELNCADLPRRTYGPRTRATARNCARPIP